MSSASITPISTVKPSFVPPVYQIESLPFPRLTERETAVQVQDAGQRVPPTFHLGLGTSQETVPRASHTHAPVGFAASVNGHAQATIIVSNDTGRR